MATLAALCLAAGCGGSSTGTNADAGPAGTASSPDRDSASDGSSDTGADGSPVDATGDATVDAAGEVAADATVGDAAVDAAVEANGNAAADASVDVDVADGALDVAVGSDASGDSGEAGALDASGGGDALVDASTFVTITIPDRPANPAAVTFVVAFQDGNGAWTLAPAPVGDVYTIPNHTGRYGVAHTCMLYGGEIRQVSLYYTTVAENPTLTLSAGWCADPAPRVTLQGTVYGWDAGGTAVLDAGTPLMKVSFGDTSASVSPSSGTFSMQVVPGTHDLVVAGSPYVDLLGSDFAANLAVVQRGVTVADAATVNVDWSAALPLPGFTLTVPAGANGASTTTVLHAGGTSATLVNETAAPFATASLGAAQASAGDFYTVQVNGGSFTPSTWSNAETTATPAAQAYSIPPALGALSSTVVATAPYSQVRTTWSAYPGALVYSWAAVQNMYSAQQCQSDAGYCAVSWDARLSPGWAGSAPAFQMPDLSGLAGWNPKLAFVHGTGATGNVSAQTVSGPQTITVSTSLSLSP